jgi:hypothetical protein
VNTNVLEEHNAPNFRNKACRMRNQLGYTVIQMDIQNNGRERGERTLCGMMETVSGYRFLILNALILKVVAEFLQNNVIHLQNYIIY